VKTQARVFKNTEIKYLGDVVLISFYFQFLVVVVVVVYPSCVGVLKEAFKNKLLY
jgi:hypothetical protein